MMMLELGPKEISALGMEYLRGFRSLGCGFPCLLIGSGDQACWLASSADPSGLLPSGSPVVSNTLLRNLTSPGSQGRVDSCIQI